MQTEANMETLSTALTACLRAETLANSCDVSDVKAMIRADNVLLDAAISCGMPQETGDFKSWSARKVAAWLASA